MPEFPGCALFLAFLSFWVALVALTAPVVLAECGMIALGVFVFFAALPWIAEGVERCVKLVRGWF